MRPLDVTAAQLMVEARTLVRLIAARELADGLEDFTVVDIRDLVDRQREGHIPGSFHIPRTVLEWRVDASAELPNPSLTDPDLKVVIVCNDGYSSLLAAVTPHRMGFHEIAHLEGGHRGWVAEGLRVTFDDPHTEHSTSRAARIIVGP